MKTAKRPAGHHEVRQQYTMERSGGEERREWMSKILEECACKLMKPKVYQRVSNKHSILQYNCLNNSKTKISKIRTKKSTYFVQEHFLTQSVNFHWIFF